jgi:hypothetical protein
MSIVTGMYFMLPQCKHCSAKILLAAYMPPLRIVIRGKFPPDHPLCIA